MIQITSKKEGFRRCGVAHTRKPKTYDDKRFTAEELEILKAETMLKVETIANEKPKKIIGGEEHGRSKNRNA